MSPRRLQAMPFFRFLDFGLVEDIVEEWLKIC